MPSGQSADAADSGGLINLNSPDIERLIKDGESSLRKLRSFQEDQEQTQHVQSTQQAYKQAVVLYKQQRLGLAHDALSNVEDSMADFKSTDTILKTIDEQRAEKLRRKMHRTRLLQDPKLVNELTRKAAQLYEQAAQLSDNENTAVVSKKLAKLKEVLEKLKQERMSVSPQAAKQIAVQQQFDQIDQKAENFDREIFQLTQSNNYPEAKKKYDEFEQSMIDDLAKLKQTMAQK